MAHLWMSHGTHMNESLHTYEGVMAHIWMSHSTHMNESWYTHMNGSWHTYTWVMSQVWMRHGTRMNESCHEYECVMAHVWMSHVTNMIASWHTYEWVMSLCVKSNCPKSLVCEGICVGVNMCVCMHARRQVLSVFFCKRNFFFWALVPKRLILQGSFAKEACFL